MGYLSNLAASAAWGEDSQPIDFGRQIQPILAENCFQCHGPDARQRQAELRLDTSEGALSTGAIKPGASGESKLIHRIFSGNPDEAMPPAKSNLKLTDAQKDLFTQLAAL